MWLRQRTVRFWVYLLSAITIGILLLIATRSYSAYTFELQNPYEVKYHFAEPEFDPVRNESNPLWVKIIQGSGFIFFLVALILFTLATVELRHKRFYRSQAEQRHDFFRDVSDRDLLNHWRNYGAGKSEWAKRLRAEVIARGLVDADSGNPTKEKRKRRPPNSL